MKIHLGAFLLLMVLSCACQNSISNNTSINGTWASIGSGWFLEIQDSATYAFYDITSISCLPSRQGKLAELQGDLVLQNDTLSMFQGVITYQFIRVQELPKLCTTLLDTPKAKDPIYNFEVFAETVKEHYAFLDLNNINWSELQATQKNKLIKTSTDAQLYLVIEETLELLKDNHAFLEATDAVDEAVDQLLEEEESTAETDESNLQAYGDFQVAAMTAKHHLKEDMTEDSWLIHWGKLTEDIGYVQVKAMWLYGDLDIPQSLRDEVGFVDAYVETFHKMYPSDYVNKELEGIRSIMDKVMDDLSTMGSLVIDVRFNGGGQDAVSFEILSRLIPEKTQIATQQLRYGDQHTVTLPIYIDGTPAAYTKPVYFLTSPQSGSAAESLAIASMSINNAKRIGSPTLGATSTALEKTLPNGWAIAISNEVYMDNAGNCYENIGVPVDYNLNYSRDRQTFFRSVADDLGKDKTDILKAIGELERR